MSEVRFKFALWLEDEVYFAFNLDYGVFGHGDTVGLALDCCLHSVFIMSGDGQPNLTEEEQEDFYTAGSQWAVTKKGEIFELTVDLSHHADCRGCASYE